MPNGWPPRPGPYNPGPYNPGPEHPIRDQMYLQNLIQQIRGDVQQLNEIIGGWQNLQNPTDEQIQNIESDAQQLRNLVAGLSGR